MNLKLVTQSEVISLLKIRCIGLGMLHLKEDVSRIGAGCSRKHVNYATSAAEFDKIRSSSQSFQSLEKDEKLDFIMNIGKRC